MVDEKYLVKLNKKCNMLRSKFKYTIIDEANCDIFYLPTKKTSFIGYKKGYYEQLLLQKYGLKESQKLRAGCKNYLQIFREHDGRILQIKSIKGGEADCIHQACYEGDAMYLFPFSKGGGYYPTYSYVSKSCGGFVQEEYMVDGKQIIYESYKEEGGKVKYESINYVVGGKVPLLSSQSGEFTFDPLSYKILSEYSWLKN